MNGGKILVADDEANHRRFLMLVLGGAGHAVDEAADGESAIEKASSESYDLVLTDLRMGRVDGLEVLRRVRETSPSTEVIVMTAYGTVESAVAAMRLGANDYLQKPFSDGELLVRVGRALERKHLLGEVSFLSKEFRDKYKCENIVGRSRAIHDVLDRIVKIAPTDATVLITGASGTGKELVAKAIHANSKRASRPFVPINCAAVAETLLESELFGHVRGSFTGAISTRKGFFEEADGGTFFFDEIAETSLSFQAKLLRTLQEGEVRRVGDNKPIKVNVRIIAATNQDLDIAISEHRFRQALYYRLNVARFHLLPLRDRREDIPLLVARFMENAQKRMGRTARLGPGVLEYLKTRDYVGNVRELENIIEQGVALATDGVVRLEDTQVHKETSVPPPGPTKSLADAVAETERRVIVAAIEGSSNLVQAAEILGVSNTTLWRKMKRLGLGRISEL